MRNFLLCIAACCMPMLANAAAKPPELATAIHSENPIGSAKFRKLFLHVYDVEFWSDTVSSTKPPYALSITYAMNFSVDDLTDRTLDEMRHVSSLPDSQLVEYATLLRSIYPQVKSGDRITALAIAGGATEFFHNGKKIGVIKNSAFAPTFFGIWLSPKSSEPEMQRQLLNQ